MNREEYVEKYTCSSCRYFRFAGNNEKSRCEHFWEWFWPDDKCKYWDEADDFYRGKRPVEK